MTAIPTEIDFDFNEQRIFHFRKHRYPDQLPLLWARWRRMRYRSWREWVGDELSGRGFEYTALTGVQQIASNPEPSTFWLGGGALGAFLLRRHFSRRRTSVA